MVGQSQKMQDFLLRLRALWQEDSEKPINAKVKTKTFLAFGF
jgi:hypothetical protein